MEEHQMVTVAQLGSRLRRGVWLPRAVARGERYVEVGKVFWPERVDEVEFLLRGDPLVKCLDV